MTADEWLGWQAFHELEPWGCYVDDHRVAQQLQLAWALHSKKPAPTWFERDLMPRPDPSPAELEERIRDSFIGRTVIVPADPPEPDPLVSIGEDGLHHEQVREARDGTAT